MARRGRTNLADESFFFVTTTVVRRARVFHEEKYCDILISEIKRWQAHYQFAVLGYVIMPTHFHWVIKVLPERGTITDVMRELKSYAAVKIMDEIQRDGKVALARLFRAAGEGFTGQQRRFWTKRFDDQVIRSQQMFMSTLDYIHMNPVKAGLVEAPEDYKYSSARNYLLGDHSVLFVDTSYAG